MDAKKATKAAKEYIIDVFGDEQIDHIGLEEVKFDEQQSIWEITIGFSRPWNRDVLTRLPNPDERSYKVVRIKDWDGRVVSVTHRALTTVD